MTPINRCPDCKKNLNAKAKRCTCGWLVIEEQPSQSTDYRCNYVEFGKRCENEGTVSHSIHGNKWYCPKHSYDGYKSIYK